MREHPTLALMENEFQERYAFLAPQFERCVATFGPRWRDEFEDTLSHLLENQEQITQAIDGYASFAIDAIRLHRTFEKTGEYVAKTYEEAANEVYLNPEYMLNLYLPGILLSHFLWPHHYRQRRFFESAFVPDVRLQGGSMFFDVGIGTGYYSRLMLATSPEMRGRGYDISPTAKQYAERHVRAFGADSRYEVVLRDVIEDTPEEQAPWIVSVEVLEHLEDPLSFLKALRRLLAPSGKAFITAALNAPNADHIYLYRTAEEVVRQLTEAGFHVEQYHFARAYVPRKPENPVPEIAAFIVS